MLVLGGVEQLADDAVVQVNDFVDDGGHTFDSQRDQSGITSLSLELCQVGGRHLTTLTGNLEQAVLVNLPLNAFGQVKRLPGFETLDVFKHVPRVWLDGRLAQPCEPRHFAAVLAFEKFVQALTVAQQQRIGQRRMDAPVGTGDSFSASALDSIHGRQDDGLPPQVFDKGAGQHNPFIGLQGQLGQCMDGLPVVAHGEGLETKHCLQLDQVLPPCLLALAVLVPAFHWHLELRGHHA